MRESQEIGERGYEIAVVRVAAVDVAKASGVVCTRVPRDGGPGFVTKVGPVDATTNAILELAADGQEVRGVPVRGRPGLAVLQQG